MSDSPAVLGLRERKRIALRRRIQEESFRLFREQGYESTTVEQIAAAADTSTTTFYRYFPVKEDVARLDDDVYAALERAMLERPVDEPLAEALRALVGTATAIVGPDEAFELGRLRLTLALPALQAGYARTEWAMVARMARVVAMRTGRAADDYRVEVVAAMITAAVFAATRRWAAANGAESYGGLLEEALAAAVPAVASLDAAFENGVSTRSGGSPE